MFPGGVEDHSLDARGADIEPDQTPEQLTPSPNSETDSAISWLITWLLTLPRRAPWKFGYHTNKGCRPPPYHDEQRFRAGIGSPIL